MHELIARAVEARHPADDYPPLIFSARGSIVVRDQSEDEATCWPSIGEAVWLPLVAGEPFVISVEGYMAAEDKVPEGGRPAEVPEAREVVLYYHWELGQLTEAIITQIHREDDGAIRFGRPEELHNAQLVSTDAGQVAEQIRMVGTAALEKERDPELEAGLAFQLARRGHIILWGSA